MTMKAEKQFDFYEFAGIVLPGAILIAGLSRVVPSIGSVVPVKDISLGSLGLFLILAYAAGHVLQSIGNLIEFLWWYFPGMPTDWVRTDRGHLLSPLQRNALEQQLPKKLVLEGAFSFSTVTAKQWFAISRQIYAAVAAATRASRIDTFNGNYGLNRGLAAAFLLVGIAVVIENRAHWPYTVALACAVALALLRMHRFGRHYARELFVQFLQLPLAEGSPDKKLIIPESSSGE
jgi:hypothetical protein